VVVASDVGTATLAVDRLRSERGGEAGEVDLLLARMPEGFPLRCVITNHRGELEKTMDQLANGPRFDFIADWDWSAAKAMTLHGGFTDEAAFEVNLTVFNAGDGWQAGDGERLAQQLATALGDADAGVEARGSEYGDLLEVELSITDLPGRFEALVEDAVEHAVPPTE
jgi:hypothetical protein